jgi:hypothetical protein
MQVLNGDAMHKYTFFDTTVEPVQQINVMDPFDAVAVYAQLE